AAETSIAGRAAIRSRDSAVIDPYRAALGLAAAAAARGATIHERSAVRKITFTRKHADVVTAAGTIRTGRVIVATGTPTSPFRSLVRHVWLHRAYFALTEPVPARIRQRLGRRDVVLRDTASPPHIIRWVDDDRILVSGADGNPTPERQRNRIMVQRTG